MADVRIELPGTHFRRAYLLYVIEILHGRERYFYVGQTGDNNYVTARPAFRRLSGHLEDIGQSTQNQVYRYIAADILGHKAAISKTSFPEGVKQDVEDFLVDSTVLMHIYRVKPFLPDIPRDDHLREVRNITLMEKYVMISFIEAGRPLMNKKVLKPTGACPYPKLLTRIKSDFDLK
jgi:hypothetical protein